MAEPPALAGSRVPRARPCRPLTRAVQPARIISGRMEVVFWGDCVKNRPNHAAAIAFVSDLKISRPSLEPNSSSHARSG